MEFTNSVLEILKQGGSISLSNGYSFFGIPADSYIELRTPDGCNDGLTNLNEEGLKQAFKYANDYSEQGE
ncbi:MAG: hypothetical protein JHC31_06315 [Sulfurihydrogenibium sp.]|nr:hypothetical protein [Sulfurihydrogenibium sp.]